MDIKNIINSIYPLSEDSFQTLFACMIKRTYYKGNLLVKAGKVENSIYFVEQGIVRAYVPGEDRDVTFWIGVEGTVVVSLKSYVKHESGYETVECMENSVIYSLNQTALEALFLQDIHIANWGRKLAETELLRTEERFIPFLFTTASKRYEELLKKHPYLFARIPLEHLASYLGITPVSLSRIRARISRR